MALNEEHRYELARFRFGLCPQVLTRSHMLFIPSWILRTQQYASVVSCGKLGNKLPSFLKEIPMDTTAKNTRSQPWNKGKLIGQKAPLKPKDMWAI
ncbi:hypothetical protein [Aquabacterium sp.]|uniref:hypothetical protein n=1 Tax=Aquabacterium sp. TaxID=1872578 RepID=UPI0025BDEFA2|nr:hypothetical protein [Aquabacterium sp.]